MTAAKPGEDVASVTANSAPAGRSEALVVEYRSLLQRLSILSPPSHRLRPAGPPPPPACAPIIRRLSEILREVQQNDRRRR